MNETMNKLNTNENTTYHSRLENTTEPNKKKKKKR